MGFTERIALWAEGIISKRDDRIGWPLIIVSALTFLAYIAEAWIGGRI